MGIASTRRKYALEFGLLKETGMLIPKPKDTPTEVNHHLQAMEGELVVWISDWLGYIPCTVVVGFFLFSKRSWLVYALSLCYSFG